MTDQLHHYENKLAFEIDSWDLKIALQKAEKVIVIDARSFEAFHKEHIPGAISIPHRKMNEETIKDIDRAALVVTYCDGIGCNASTKGALNMAKLGFRVSVRPENPMPWAIPGRDLPSRAGGRYSTSTKRRLIASSVLK